MESPGIIKSAPVKSSAALKVDWIGPGHFAVSHQDRDMAGVVLFTAAARRDTRLRPSAYWDRGLVPKGPTTPRGFQPETALMLQWTSGHGTEERL